MQEHAGGLRWCGRHDLPVVRIELPAMLDVAQRRVVFGGRYPATANGALAPRVRLHNGATSILEEHGVSAELERALRSKVWLPQGGYIVINQTEALVAIDVNTGRFVGKNQLEETLLRVSQLPAEAAAQHARRRLRK